ncbi:MAG: DoxX family membrane protein [Opitutaceae bacterium]|nr:DoxX family membrane protein [Opitutaceae bacterium]
MKSDWKFLQRSSPQSLLRLRWSLGAVFCLAGFFKISDPIGFHADLLAYELAMPDVVSRLIAVVFPCLELICGIGLIIGFWRESVSLLAVTMSLVFVLILTQAMARGLDLNCGCFGSARGHWLNLPSIALIRACLMLMAAFWLHRRISPTYSI